MTDAERELLLAVARLLNTLGLHGENLTRGLGSLIQAVEEGHGNP